jgi:transposase
VKVARPGRNPSVKRIAVVPHLRPSKIDYRYRSCRDAHEKTRWHVIWLLTRPGSARSAHAVSKLVGMSSAWAAEILKRWNAHGPDGLLDGRRENGSKPLLSERQQAALVAALRDRAPDGGLWTGPKVGHYVRARWGITINPATGWKWLQRLGFSLQVPRPSHPKAAGPTEQRRWKKSPAPARAGPPAETPDEGRGGVDGG